MKQSGFSYSTKWFAHCLKKKASIKCGECCLLLLIWLGGNQSVEASLLVFSGGSWEVGGVDRFTQGLSPLATFSSNRGEVPLIEHQLAARFIQTLSADSHIISCPGGKGGRGKHKALDFDSLDLGTAVSRSNVAKQYSGYLSGFSE